LILIGAIANSAILHYNSVDDALKIWSGLTALVGVITGAFVSYFFTRGTAQAAQQTAQAAQQTAQVARESAQGSQQTAQQAEQLAQVAQKQSEVKGNALSATLALINDPTVQQEVMSHPAVREALEP
jgi:phosphoenolpyruvate-protein kinase (PTS system EI component)